jgi:hypothetical protein
MTFFGRAVLLEYQSATRLGGSATLAAIGLALVVACTQRAGQPATGPAMPAHAQKPNQVVLYLDGAERQAETDEQCQETLRALGDLRTLDPETLKRKRYADYENRSGRWTLVQLLQKYFVPPELRSIDDEEAFYRDAASPHAREVVDQQIRALREGHQVFPTP